MKILYISQYSPKPIAIPQITNIIYAKAGYVHLVCIAINHLRIKSPLQ